MFGHPSRYLAVAAFALLALSRPGFAAQDPEGITQKIEKSETVAKRYMAVTAHGLASKAASDILAQGGSAADAAITAQLVLTLVEPQSSGLGGGGFLTYYDAKADKLTIYDGRETTPAAAGPNLFLGADGQPLRFFDAGVGGRPVGTPGAVRLLEAVHKDHGKLPWAKLFQPAIDLAEKGFEVTERLHWWLDSAKSSLSASPAIRALYYNPDGSALKVGQILRNPDLAKTFRLIAEKGADAFYTGPLAEQIVASVKEGMAVEGKPSPGLLSLDDLKNYKLIKRDAVCGNYRKFQICGPGAPSGGTIGVLEILGMLEKYEPAQIGPSAARTFHLFAEASRRAFADRDAYVGDPAFVEVPTKGLLDPSYLLLRSGTINRDRVTEISVQPGNPPGRRAEALPDATEERAGTTHMSIIDANGDGVSFTTTVNGPFGSRLMAGGFILNNQLTDFNFRPEIDGKKAANRVEGGKRPRSSMSPLIIFDNRKKMRLLIGSPGGSKIIDYVALAVIANLDWNMNAQEAVDFGHVVNIGTRTELEAGTPLAGYADTLGAMGHQIEVMSETSGLSAIAVMPDGLHGGADGRREGGASGK